MLSAFGHRVAGRLPYLVPCLLYVLCEHLNDADGFRAVLGFDAQTKGAILTVSLESMSCMRRAWSARLEG